MYERVMKLCERQNVTLSELCAETGIKPNVFSNLKKRGGNLSTKNTYTVARYFGVTMEDLMGTGA